MSNLGAFLAVVIPSALVLYVIRGDLVSRQAHEQMLEKARRIQRDNEALDRYNRALRRNLEVSQDRKPEEPMPVIQPYYDYPFPATQPPEDQ